MQLALGERTYDLRSRALVMGILNRTKDSFFDNGAYWDLDKFYRRAETLVVDGADILDIGGVKAGVGPEVTEAEETDRVVPVVEALTKRFDVPLSVDTWRASVAAESYRAGAVMGNDISGFSDPDYLRAAASAGATVVATHIRLQPRVLDPDPHYDDVMAEVIAYLLERVEWARTAGMADERIIIDPGLDLGKSTPQSALLLAGSARFVALGFPVLLPASNKDFLGELFGLAVGERRVASIAAFAVGVSLGCRILRAHDVAGARRVCDTLAAVMSAP
ncbi:MAG TPA: dihydropteroate synthase [Acidimicrobiales bacterium]